MTARMRAPQRGATGSAWARESPTREREAGRTGRPRRRAGRWKQAAGPTGAGAAGDRAHTVDVWFSDISADLGELGSATLRLVSRPQTNAKIFLPALPTLRDSVRHGAAVSFEQPIVHWLGKASGAPPTASISELLSLLPWMRLSLAAGLPYGEGAANDASRANSVAGGPSTARRSFIGIEADGGCNKYPGR